MSIRRKAIIFIIGAFIGINSLLIVAEILIFASFRDQVLFTQADEMYQAMVDNSLLFGNNLDRLFAQLDQEAGSRFLDSIVREQPETFLITGYDGQPLAGQPAPAWYRALDRPAYLAQLSRNILDHQTRYVHVPPLSPGMTGHDWPDAVIVRVLEGMKLVLHQHIPMDSTRVRIAWLHQKYEATIANLTTLALTLNLAGILVLSLLTMYYLNTAIIAPLRRIQSLFNSFSPASSRVRWTGTGQDEIGVLGTTFNQMADDLQSWQDRLDVMVTNRNSELEEVRRQTAFGSMMAAGIAHDLKSPLSSVNTAVTWLANSSRELRRSLEDQTMTRKDLTDFLDAMDEGVRIMDSALQKAIDLSRSFKEVVADQLGGNIRSFHLASYLDDILLSIRPRLKKTGVQAELACPGDIQLVSDPGALSQVLINLMENSLVHAFNAPVFQAALYSSHTAKRIRLDITSQEAMVRIAYRDNGTGLDSAVRDNLFQGMYTTRRTEGGTGYGMVMIRELVTNRLKGSIVLSDEPASGWCPGATCPGVCFVITVPRVHPDPGAGPARSFPATP